MERSCGTLLENVDQSPFSIKPIKIVVCVAKVPRQLSDAETWRQCQTTRKVSTHSLCRILYREIHTEHTFVNECVGTGVGVGTP